MPVRLEPVYLANVLLFVSGVDAIKAFPFVSKHCQVATLTLKVNPAAFSHPPRDILRFFPNINTMNVDDLTDFKKSDTLPDTVTALVVKCVNFTNLPKGLLRYADRVVEIQSSRSFNRDLADVSLFPTLQRLSLDTIPDRLVMPGHKLKTLRVRHPKHDKTPLDVFPAECAEQIVHVFDSKKAVATAKAQPLPPNVRVFCSSISKGITPEDVFKWGSQGRVTLSEKFGVDKLRAFNETLPLPYSAVTVPLKTRCAVCDVSFLTGITSLFLSCPETDTIILPTNVVQYFHPGTKEVTVSGTENLTFLGVIKRNIRTAPLPKLRELDWRGGVLSDETLPFPIGDLTTLSKLNVFANDIDPAFRFPTQLTSLGLDGHNAVDIAAVTRLTRLQELNIELPENENPLDLSGLTALTKLFTDILPVSRFPTSIVEYRVSLCSVTDLSFLTNLTSLSLSLEWGTRVTFPTGLKKLVINGGKLSDSNISAVSLEYLEMWGGPVTHDDLAKLPKTLRMIDGLFYPESLKEHLGETFPLLE